MNDNNFTIEKLQEAIDKIEKITKPSIKAILLTYKVHEIYQVEYENNKYILMPYPTWILNKHFFEQREWSVMGQMTGIPAYEDDDLVEKILKFVCEWYVDKLRRELVKPISLIWNGSTPMS
jgi:hypothetical protein